MRKKWIFSRIDKERAAALSESCSISAMTALLLSAQGMDSPQTVHAFLDDDVVLQDPYSLKDMDKAVASISAAMENGERICIYGDYDADGVTAVSLLYSFLDAMGCDVVYYIPSRLEEGYGVHPQAIEKIVQTGASLIITVDTGITAFEAAEKADRLGVRLVITDHHKPSSDLPKAAAVVDPHRVDDASGLEYLAGVGVAFYLVRALAGGEDEDLLSFYSQFAAVGTIADVVPLVHDNRRIVRSGLRLLNERPLIGLDVLAEMAGLQGKQIVSTNVAFGLAPRINAAGRMGNAETALRLLLSDTRETASYYATELSAYNGQRHEAEKEIADDIVSVLANHPEFAVDPVLVVSAPGWHEGVLGIVASRLCGAYGKPAVVLTERPDGTAKGSCRSVSDFSVYDALCASSAFLTHFGGHRQAAGLGLATEDIPAFREAINDYARAHLPSCEELKICCKLMPTGVSSSLLESLQMLEPFGEGNPKPVFVFSHMRLEGVDALGGGKHLRLRLSRDGAALQAIKFGMTPEQFPFHTGDTIDIAALVEPNEYKGTVHLSVQIQEMRFSGTDDDTLFRSYQLFRQALFGCLLSEAQKKEILPNRTFVGSVYLYIKSHGGESCTPEVILHRLHLPEQEFGRVCTSIRALSECSLIAPSGSGWVTVPGAMKTDLGKSPLLTALGYQAQV